MPGPGGTFEERVRAVLLALRPGDVVTYGEVAAEAGSPRAARAVGNVLAGSDGLPWWRVVSASGRLVAGHEREQARRLRADGVPVDLRAGRVRPGYPPAGWPKGRTKRIKARSRARAIRSASTGS